MNITDIQGKEILDSRGNPTLEITVSTDTTSGTYSVPAGASTGAYEVVDIAPRKELAILSKLKESFLGIDVQEQQKIDTLLHKIDGTGNLGHIGGDLALGISVAASVCAANTRNLEIYEYLRTLEKISPSQESPYLFVNLINGGKHAEGGSPLQEHQIIPETTDPKIAFDTATAVQNTLKENLEKSFSETEIHLGDEGGFVFPTRTIEEPFQHLHDAVKKSRPSVDMMLGTDCAANSFYVDGKYTLKETSYSTEELLSFYASLIKKFPALRSFEDPFEEEDFESFAAFKRNHSRSIIIGDDLTTTNKSRLEKAVGQDSINALIIKPNQIGTLSDTLETMKYARNHGVHCIVSHRSGSTMDTFIADLAYAFGCYGLKAGAPQAKERAVKYNRLIEIYNHDRN